MRRSQLSVKRIEIDPNYVIAHANRGLTYSQQKRYTEALKDIDRAIGLGYKEDWVLQLREQVKKEVRGKE